MVATKRGGVSEATISGGCSAIDQPWRLTMNSLWWHRSQIFFVKFAQLSTEIQMTADPSLEQMPFAKQASEGGFVISKVRDLGHIASPEGDAFKNATDNISTKM
ncbi:hypothetical protein RRG08_015247 [Elysia crispata]|uniref:Uncharacterized protein n=1 Tax=Elysia crispata TaxID=231223 RepID=A0AAE0YZN6_9GAST|nr:hypothetical protein RRG08_015247 [Elysia crispata]